MIGMVLVTHGRLASEFISALEHVVGPQEQIQAVCIGPDDDMERRRQDILDHVGAVDDGDGVVILTDMFGGTPSNLAISVLSQGRVEVIAGVNLPMLIKLATLRKCEPLDEIVGNAQEAGRKYINVASQLLDGGIEPNRAGPHGGGHQGGAQQGGAQKRGGKQARAGKK
jgi:PTS system mannose-specific IIA component